MWVFEPGEQLAAISKTPIVIYCNTVASNRLPQTTAYVRITRQSWQQGKIEGEVWANQFEWQFEWCFQRGELSVQPSLGRALIQEPLGRFLEQRDYQLELGSDYSFTIRGEV